VEIGYLEAQLTSSYNFKGPSLPMALEMESSPHQNHFVPPHINKRYINSYSILNSLIQCIEAGLKQLTTGRNTHAGLTFSGIPAFAYKSRCLLVFLIT
jgi:hypothetical protein